MTDLHDPEAPFHHVALLYDDDNSYLAATVPFIRGGLDNDEPVLVAVPQSRLELLRSEFDDADGDLLQLAPMEEMGRNPARIISAWGDFVRSHGGEGRSARGIGEPIWRGRSAEEIVECERHEALINLAFADCAGFTLLCPYDTTALDGETIDEAFRNHPHIASDGSLTSSSTFDPAVPALLQSSLSPVPIEAELIPMAGASPRQMRSRIAAIALDVGLDEDRANDLVLAISEVHANSIRYGGGLGSVAVWLEPGALVCEVRDEGRIDDPLAGRLRPPDDAPDGRGLWLINQLCDLVQLRATPNGQLIRFHISR